MKLKFLLFFSINIGTFLVNIVLSFSTSKTTTTTTKKLTTTTIRTANLLNVFESYSLNASFSTVNGIAIGGLIGFGMQVSTNASYYIADHSSNKIYAFNDNWIYQYQLDYQRPNYIFNTNSSNDTYIVGMYNIFHSDTYLNIKNKYKQPSNWQLANFIKNDKNLWFNGTIYNSWYGAAFLNSETNLLYVAANRQNVIVVINLNFSINNIIPIPRIYMKFLRLLALKIKYLLVQTMVQYLLYLTDQ